MGVVIRRYIDILTIIINFPYSTCISSFFGSSIPTSLFIFKCFFGLISIIFLQYIANVTQRTCTRWMRSSHVARARNADCSKNSCQGNNCSDSNGRHTSVTVRHPRLSAVQYLTHVRRLTLFGPVLCRVAILGASIFLSKKVQKMCSMCHGALSRNP